GAAVRRHHLRRLAERALLHGRRPRPSPQPAAVDDRRRAVGAGDLPARQPCAAVGPARGRALALDAAGGRCCEGDLRRPGRPDDHAAVARIAAAPRQRDHDDRHPDPVRHGPRRAALAGRRRGQRPGHAGPSDAGDDRGGGGPDRDRDIPEAGGRRGVLPGRQLLRLLPGPDRLAAARATARAAIPRLGISLVGRDRPDRRRGLPDRCPAGRHTDGARRDGSAGGRPAGAALVVPPVISSRQPRRTMPVRSLLALLALLAAGPADAASIFSYGGDLLVGSPTGAFRDYVSVAGGLSGFALWAAPRGFLGFRVDGSSALYGSETLHVPVARQLSRISVDVTTDNWIAHVAAGPQLMVPSGRVRPYVNAFAGLSY